MADPAPGIRLALAQMNPTVGDVPGNADLIAARIEAARERGAQLVILPELALTGYPPEDLLLKRHFLEAAAACLEDLARGVEGIVAMVGFPQQDVAVHNALAVLADGGIAATYRKMLLPNYGVFDERRYFEPGPGPALVEVGEAMVGLTVCEDIWYPGPPASVEALAGANLIANPSASPYHRGKGTARERMIAERARETGAAFAVCNMVGAQDELVFDGHSVVIAADGRTVARGTQFADELVVCDLELPAAPRPGDWAGAATAEAPSGASAEVLARLEVTTPEGRVEARLPEPLPEEAEVYTALTIGLRDYIGKNGFEHVLVALSGGIDSALVALLAADALGADGLTCVVMPSPHSSAETQDDARRIATNLGAQLIEIPIKPAMEAYGRLLDEPFAATGGAARPGVAEENVQARIRGNLIMALSNKLGWLVLATGNKSELSVGYATLYGDMAGGFAVIKDVPKTLVYRLVEHRNAVAGRELVPASVVERAPSAELRPEQRDTDSLPPYETLDRILAAYVEGDQGREEIVDDGLPAELVDEVIRMVDRAEYKRRQAPPGVKITPKAFGRDRRLPITNRFRG